MAVLSGISELTADAVLTDARELCRLERLVGATKLIRAAEWADLHPARDDDEGAWDPEASSSLPRLTWDAPAEFALACGLKTESGRQLIHEALEIRHRLPRIWSRLISGQVDGWRARRIAAVTIGEPDDVAAAIDAVAAPIAHKIGLITLDRLLTETLIRLYPERALEASRKRLDGRHVRVYDQMSHEGVMEVQIKADLKDVLDFDRTVAEIAAALADAGCPESLDVRRSMAVGVLADPERAAEMLDRSPATPSAEGPEGDPDEKPSRTPAHRPRKRAVLHFHLSEQAVAGTSPVGRMEHADRVVLAERIRDWCGREDTHLTVLPVRDLAEHIAVDSYDIPDRLSEQTELAQPSCVFPWCTRPARRCDKDHAIPHAAGGRTCSCNLAPLCRHHHRLKTHTLWRYEVIDRGSYLWTAPHGRQYHRDHTGTTEVAPATRPAADHHSDRSPPDSGCLHAQSAWDFLTRPLEAHTGGDEYLLRTAATPRQ